MLTLIELLIAALYGLVEGITEWLPISSTGHMLLLDQFVSIPEGKDFWDMFLVVIQLGAILAVCVLYFLQLNPLSRTKSSAQKKATWTLWAKIIVACLPAAVIGIPLDNWMEEHLGSPFVIAAALIVYGIIFIVIEKIRETRARKLFMQDAGVGESSPKSPVLAGTPRHMRAANSKSNVSVPRETSYAVSQAKAASLTQEIQQLADRDARVQSIDELDWKTAIGIGIFQVLSMVPGTSRSGSTIIGGLILGCSRTVAAQFTFFLAIPVMVGASGLRLVKYFLKGNVFSSTQAAVLICGCIVAFVVSLVVIKFLLSYIKKHDFKPFGWYRIALGVVVIIYFACFA